MDTPPDSPVIKAFRDAVPVTARCVYLQTGTKCPISEPVLKALVDAEWLAAREGPVTTAGKAPLVAAAEEARAALRAC